MKTISRELVSLMCPEYKEILERESHHNHPIIIDEKGTIRWQEDEDLKNADVNTAVITFHKLGFDKNTELYRRYYRGLGYSLSGYWEIFYWEANNEKQSEYRPKV